MLSACRYSRAPNLSAWPHDDLCPARSSLPRSYACRPLTHAARPTTVPVPHGTGRPCLWDVRSPGHAPAIQQRIVMAMHSRGMRDTVQMLHASMPTVLIACNKESDLEHMHQ